VGWAEGTALVVVGVVAGRVVEAGARVAVTAGESTTLVGSVVVSVTVSLRVAVTIGSSVGKTVSVIVVVSTTLSPLSGSSRAHAGRIRMAARNPRNITLLRIDTSSTVTVSFKTRARQPSASSQRVETGTMTVPPRDWRGLSWWLDDVAGKAVPHTSNSHRSTVTA
jgi:hypothetical protein